MLLMKNLQFLVNLPETLAFWLTHVVDILAKFQINWAKIVDFSLVAYFRDSAISYYPVST